MATLVLKDQDGVPRWLGYINEEQTQKERLAWVVTQLADMAIANWSQGLRVLPENKSPAERFWDRVRYRWVVPVVGVWAFLTGILLGSFFG